MISSKWVSEGSDSVCVDQKYINASERLLRSLRGPEQNLVFAAGLLFQLHNRKLNWTCRHIMAVSGYNGEGG
ncbi:hypothetical protein KZX70_08415 [Paenibacillus silvae]|uniref:hypothetical protein n=1 Tax=Paenibacillus silvae TaxID=1325358 RepID=UPI0020062601|nr:hypothetical protein [Paenibacillus silvae]MCK6074865.1 hypothetical protein [Paenibacillus silvae]MCK6147660.1 hypothetical protein [Paenibacillus silvae]MCK6265958.1 hypothetical protein [Paenibacillus silvae]